MQRVKPGPGDVCHCRGNTGFKPENKFFLSKHVYKYSIQCWLFAPSFHLNLNSSWPRSFQQICSSSVKKPAFIGRLFLVCGKQFFLLSPAAEKDAFDGLLFI